MDRPAGVIIPLLRHTFSFVGTVLSASALLSVLLALVPGDAIDTLPNGAELRPLLAQEWGLDQPLPQRILRALLRALTGDWGVSLTVRPGQPVGELMAANAGRSLALILVALICSAMGAVVLGKISAQNRAIAWATAVLSAAPGAVLGLALVTGINAATFTLVETGVISRPAWFALPSVDSPVRSVVAVLVLVLGSSQLGSLASEVGTQLSRLNRSPFVIAEQARAGTVGRLLARHLVVPLIRALAASLPALLSSLIVVERGLGLGGCGALFWSAVQGRDWPLASGLACAAAVVVASGRLFAETFAVLWDPRERVGA